MIDEVLYEDNHIDDLYTKKNQMSRVIYKDIFEGVDLEYIVNSDYLKENIILNQYIKDFSIQFIIKGNKLTYQINESNEIEFYKDNRLVYTIDNLYMVDTNGAYSESIIQTIEQLDQNEFLLTITPNDSWLSEATYPVTVDPTFKMTDYTQMEDGYIYSASPSTVYGSYSYLNAGKTTSGATYNSYLKFNMPEVLNDKFFMYANLELYATNRYSCPTEGCKVNIYRVTEGWNEGTLSYNNRPTHDSKISAYEYITNTYQTFNFDISQIVKHWENNGDNFGLMLEAEQGRVYFASSEYYTTSVRPTFYIGFVDPTGLEDYWTYHSQSLGESGLGYIQDNTGFLTWQLPLYTNPTIRTPFSLSMIHNSNNNDLDLGYGLGWQTSLTEKVGGEEVNDDTVRYYIIDGDGTKKYFKEVPVIDIVGTPGIADSAGYAEDGTGDFAVFGISSAAYPHEYRYKDGTIKYYDYYGRLARVKINHNSFTINYNGTTDRISSIVDTIGNSVSFNYNSANQLDRIVLPDGNFYKFTISSKKLLSVQLFDKNGVPNVKTTFTYEGNRIKTVDNSYGHQVIYNYNSGGRVNRVETREGIQSLGHMEMVYKYLQTEFTDYKGNKNYYRFDRYGHTINILDSFGNAQYFKYTDYMKDEGGNVKLNHHLKEQSLPQKNTFNPIENHSFEFGLNNWQTVNSGVGNISAIDNCGMFDIESIPGITSTGCAKIERQSTGGSLVLQQTIQLDQGRYVISGYIYDPLKMGARIEVQGSSVSVDGYPSYGNGEWSKFKQGFIVSNDDTQVTIQLINDDINTVYFDQIQLIEGFVDQRYNYLTGSSFEGIQPSNWILNNAQHITYFSEEYYDHVLGDKGVRINGNGSLKQSLTGILPGSHEIIFGGWFKGDIPSHENERIEIILHFYSNGYLVSQPFTIDPNHVSDWHYIMFKYNPGSNVSLGQIEIRYTGTGTLTVDHLQMYVEEFGATYYYNDHGNVIKIDQPGVNHDTTSDYYQDTIVFDDNNKNHDVKTITQGDIKQSLDYDSLGRATESISPNNVKQTFQYDSYGNVKLSRLTDSTGSLWFDSKTTYSHMGNYVDTVEDEFGNKIDYNYDGITGLLQNVIDPKGVKTSYTYDALGRLLTVIKDDASATYTYSGNQLYTIDVNGYLFKFNYDDYNRLSNIQIANKTFIQYIYETEKDTVGATIITNRLKQQIYGNGDSIAFVYDEEDRVSSVNVNNQLRYAYEYDALGNIAVYNDYWNNKIFYYNYDLVGRLTSIHDEDQNKIVYDYDDNNGSVSQINFNINGFLREITYDYNDTTGQYQQTSYDANGKTVTKSYVYDTFGRLQQMVTKHGTTEIQKTVLYFASDVKSGYGNTSTRVKRIEVNGRWFEFQYDQLGNITEIKDSLRGLTRYHYDELGQLLREDNEFNNRTNVYTYDSNGNIKTYRSYGYTTSTTLSTTLYDWLDFDYSATWTDQLSAYQGQVDGKQIYTEIYYDGQGNPEYIASSHEPSTTLAWDGRQLVTLSNSNHHMTFKYNDSGIRTEKVVNGVKTEYFVLGDQVIEERTGSSSIYYTYDVDGTIISFNYKGNEYFYTRNIFGDIIEIKDRYNNVLVQYEYDAWGNITYTSDTSGMNLAKVNPYRYRGYRYDEETGYYYLNSRYYEPEIRRFISTDSIIGQQGDLLGHNLYAYTQNNPIMFNDQSGYWFETALDIISLGLSIYDVYKDPSDPWNWVAVGADLASVALPVVAAGGALVKGAKVGDKLTDTAKIIDNSDDLVDLAKGAGKAGVFDVGIYDEIAGTVKGLDAHHVGQKALMSKFIPDYNPNKAPAILVPKVGHTIKGPNGIVSRSTKGIDNARQLIARDIMELRRVYPDIPNSQLQKLIDLNKQLYPSIRIR